MVEEELHVVGHLTPQPAAHIPAHIRGDVETVGLRQFTDACGSGRLVPRLQIEGRIDIRLGTESRPPQDRFQTDATGEDHDDPAAMGLTVLSQPTQERISRPFALRHGALPTALEQPVDEDR